ncbi:MAG: phosphate/phosphite/phosphonate ABC transporter substrate-binding protein [Myxococcales bacterium]
MATALVLAALLASGAHAAEAKKDSLGVVIVYLGGPDAGGEGKSLIDQLVAELVKATGLEPGALEGSYFTENGPAVAQLEANPDSFVLGSLGFFLSQRQGRKLVPLARLKSTLNGTEQFHILVKKGRYKSLDELKGKQLWGSPLYEDPRFIDKVIFSGKLEAAKHFELKPTSRPLSAVRKLQSGKVDAVLLNTVQYESLRRMPLFDEFEQVYVSEPMPSLGLMMVDTPKTRAMKDKLVTTLLGLCGTPQGKSVCRNFGITGFEPIDEAALQPVIKQFEGAK